MTCDLILMRHAKSDWNDPDLSDHDRPINKRGRKSARAIGSWLKVHKFEPDEILCSSATRAQQTLGKVQEYIGYNARSKTDPNLYLAEVRTMLAVLKMATGNCVMMVGHNPGMALFVAGMCNAPSLHPDFNHYPTCATTVLRFPISNWSDITIGTGELLDFVAPKQLLG